MAQRNNIIIPTLEEQAYPEQIPPVIKEKLFSIPPQALHPLNLFRITWKGEPGTGSFGPVNYLEIPQSLTRVRPRILALLGHHFPTGSYQVGPSSAAIVSRLVLGQFHPHHQTALWPVVGGHSQGGLYSGTLLGCPTRVLLLEGEDYSHFHWAHQGVRIKGARGITGLFRNNEQLQKKLKGAVLFNPFQDFINHLWHYQVTGAAIEEVFSRYFGPEDRLAGFVSSSLTAGILGAGDYIKDIFPNSFLAVSRACKSPTSLWNGGTPYSQVGIGEGFVPWIQNVRNTDFLVPVHEEETLALLRLFQEEEGLRLLQEYAPLLDPSFFGFSSLQNLQAAIKMAKYLELSSSHILFTIFNPSLYPSPLQRGETKISTSYTRKEALIHLHRYLWGIQGHPVQELGYEAKKELHHRKYYPWVEELGQEAQELEDQWYYHHQYWDTIHRQGVWLDEVIRDFNGRTGLLPS